VFFRLAPHARKNPLLKNGQDSDFVLFFDLLPTLQKGIHVATIDLSSIAAGNGGFVINGQCAGDYSGWSVAGAGDINGDGLDDLIIGAPYASPGGRYDAGRSYVVFGKTGSTAIDLSAIANGIGGFVINGQTA